MKEVTVVRYTREPDSREAVWVVRVGGKTLVLSDTETALIYDEIGRQWPEHELLRIGRLARPTGRER